MTGLRFALGAPVRRDHRRAVVTARSYVTRRYDLRYADGQTELSVPEPDLRPEGGVEAAPPETTPERDRGVSE